MASLMEETWVSFCTPALAFRSQYVNNYLHKHKYNICIFVFLNGNSLRLQLLQSPGLFLLLLLYPQLLFLFLSLFLLAHLLLCNDNSNGIKNSLQQFQLDRIQRDKIVKIIYNTSVLKIIF